jgi:hypothetical protein
MEKVLANVSDIHVKPLPRIRVMHHTTLKDENAWFAFKIKEQPMKEAVENYLTVIIESN